MRFAKHWKGKVRAWLAWEQLSFCLTQFQTYEMDSQQEDDMRFQRSDLVFLRETQGVAPGLV
jgi:hypothetical protein